MNDVLLQKFFEKERWEEALEVENIGQEGK